MEKKQRKTKVYNPNNCDSCVRQVHQVDEHRTVIMTGKYAHSYRVYVQHSYVLAGIRTEMYEFKNSQEAYKAFNQLKRKTKPYKI